MVVRFSIGNRRNVIICCKRNGFLLSFSCGCFFEGLLFKRLMMLFFGLKYIVFFNNVIGSILLIFENLKLK